MMDRSWLAYAEAILVEDLEKEDRNLNHLREITNALLSGIVDGNENEAKECIDDDVHDEEVDAKPFVICYHYSSAVGDIIKACK